MNNRIMNFSPKMCMQQVIAFFKPVSVWTLAALAFLTLSTNLHAQGLSRLWKAGKETPNEFIVPPDENPQGISPAHWGLVDKKTMPADIPSLQQPPQPTSRWPDYEPTTPVGAYRPSQPTSSSDYHPVQNNGANYAPQQAPPEQAIPVASGSSLLRITPEEDAFQVSPFHVKEKSPSLGEILKTGVGFISYESIILEPHFQGNTAITVDSATNSFSRSFDFDLQHAPLVNLGFESKKGPGAMLTYWQTDANSELASVTVGGTDTATASVWLIGPQRTTSLTAAPGRRLTAQHSMDIKSLSAIVFKEMKMPVSRLNGMMGMKYVRVSHVMVAELFDGGNNRLDTLFSSHEFTGFGPTIGMEYFRPIGHTHIEFLGGGGMALLFGHGKQFVSNPSISDFTSYGADELIAYMDAKLGAQWVREWGQKYRVFVRGTLQSKVWFGGGAASDPFRDMGLYGFGVAFGLNH